MFLVGIVAFSACNRLVETRRATSLPTDVSPELSAIDSLMWQRPDSALTCLLPYFDTCSRDGVHTVSTTHDCHYANLLLSELLYKNDNPQLNRAELLQAVDYYDSLCCRDAARHVSTDPILMFLDARAHYINGVGYYERDSVVEACQEYLKALEVMEERFEEKEMVGMKAQFMALTYTHLIELFSDQYLHKQTVFFGKMALGYFNKYNAPPWHIVWVLDEIGLQFDILEDNDSALFYYDRGLKLLNDTNNLTFRDVSSHLTFLSYKEGMSPNIALYRLNVLKNRADSDKEYYSRCLSIGEILYHEKQYDSALFYYEIVFDNTQSVNAKKLAAKRLVEICKTKKTKTDYNEYVDFLIPFTDQEEANSSLKTQLTELYKTYNQRRLRQIQHQEKKKNQKWTSVTVICLLVAIMFVAILYRINKKKKQHLEIEMEEERLSHKMKQSSLSGRLKQKNQEIRKLKDQINQEDCHNTKDESAALFTEEPIFLVITDRVNKGQFKSQMDYTLYKNYSLTKEQMHALHKAVDNHFNLFTTRLKKSYPELTHNDLDYCCLYLLGLSDADISALLQKAYATVSQRSRKIKAILGKDLPLPIALYNFAIDKSIG